VIRSDLEYRNYGARDQQHTSTLNS